MKSLNNIEHYFKYLQDMPSPLSSYKSVYTNYLRIRDWENTNVHGKNFKKDLDKIRKLRDIVFRSIYEL